MTIIAPIFLSTILLIACSELAEVSDVENLTAKEMSIFALNTHDEDYQILSNEWTHVNPGRLPLDASIKIDLQTGQTFAKVDRSSSETNIKKTRKFLDPGKNKTVTLEYLKAGLKAIKEKVNLDDLAAKKEKKIFLGLTELFQELTTPNISSITDSVGGVLLLFLSNYTNCDISGKVHILTELEFLLHEYHIAQKFVKIGGLDKLLPDLKSTHSVIQEYVALTLGSAVQGNPPVQQAAYNKNVMPVLLYLVEFGQSKVQARALYAISALIRQFPIAQKKFVESGGIKLLASLFMSAPSAAKKLQVKIVSLIHDLITEHQLALEHAYNGDILMEVKTTLYKSFDIETEVKDNGFCSHISELLVAKDVVTQERIINAMHSLRRTCKDEFKHTLGKLKELEGNYKSNALQELSETMQKIEYYDLDLSDISILSDLYFLEMYNTVSSLIFDLVNVDSKDEL